ncbi:MAG: hypothetical protein NTX25_09570, partial [Proteobacteria bacterium]|nr:hypothetical protein [Pseudomonadota bacterium]
VLVGPPYPSWKLSILDQDKLEQLQENWQKIKSLGLAPEQVPDLRTAIDNRLSPSFGARAPQNASAKDLLALACQGCHIKKLDPKLGKSQFRADQSKTERTAFNSKNAIARLNILKNDPANPLAMPPRLFMDITEAEIELLIQELEPR